MLTTGLVFVLGKSIFASTAMENDFSLLKLGLLISLLGLTGLFRFAVDSGDTRLVGSSSSEGQRYASFSATFGTDPITVVFTAANASAPYLEQNLRRLGALEIDLAHDSRDL